MSEYQPGLFDSPNERGRLSRESLDRVIEDICKRDAGTTKDHNRAISIRSGIYITSYRVTPATRQQIARLIRDWRNRK